MEEKHYLRVMSELHITKEFRFEGAHALVGYDGKCRRIHGHSYILQITLSGTPVCCTAHPKDGMVMDFTDLKAIVDDKLLSWLDHSLLLRRDAPLAAALQEAYDHVWLLDFQPTCENLTRHIAETLIPAIPLPSILERVRLYESPSSFAEWVNQHVDP